MSTIGLPRRRREERGYAAVLTAVFVAFVMLPACAIAIDVARMYLEIQRVQNAADAAALAAVTYLPDDFNAATTTAKAVTRKNGYADQGDVAVTVALGAKPTQLKVTVTSTIKNSFAAAFGMDVATVKRSAVADYNGPAPMGSPCNNFGNEPLPWYAETTAPGQQTVAAQPGGATCSPKPDFWAAIAGPNTPKGNGDAVMTRNCPDGETGCNGTVNAEFDPTGYFYAVRVEQSAVGQPVRLQVFDPAHVSVGDNCENAPKEVEGTTTRLEDVMNPYTHDGLTRYAGGAAGNFCTGDVGSNVITSFGVRGPTDTYQPVNGAPMTDCVRQFPSYAADKATSKTLRDKLNDGTDNGSYRPAVARVFRQWVDLCTFTPTTAGDYYIQVRTNVSLAGATAIDAIGGVYGGNQRVFSQTDDDTAVGGSGNNRFAFRAVGPAKASVSISGWEEMGVYANYPQSNTIFNLVRVIPAAASKTLIITFFDVGDAAGSGTIKVLKPLDSNLPDNLAGCTGSGVRSGPLTSCELINVSSGSGWNRKTQTVRVPIPADYTCESTQRGGCWFRLTVSFPSAVTDTTTWSARVEGDPVRLIE